MLSHLAGEPSNSPDDVHLFAAAFVGLVERIVRDDPNPWRITVGNVLETFGDEAHAVMKHENARRRG